LVLDYQYQMVLGYSAYKNSETGTLTKLIDPVWATLKLLFPVESKLIFPTEGGVSGTSHEEHSSMLDPRTVPDSAMLTGFEQHRHAGYLPDDIDFARELK
jgi:hypothetical protein